MRKSVTLGVVAILCGMAAVRSIDRIALGQAGSTGGTIGKTDKSVSGGDAEVTSGNFSISPNVSGGVHNMRDGPGISHSLVIAIPAGSSGVSLGRCQESDDRRTTQPWCRADWHGYSGWISLSGIVGAGLR
jgi:SH3-like domain-containing protein